MTDRSPRPQRISAPSWLDRRLVLGVLLVLGSVTAGARLLAGSDSRTPLLAFTHDRGAGYVITAEDVTPVRAELPASSTARYVRSSAGAVGNALAEPVKRGELVTRSSMVAPPDSVTLAVPLTAGAAPDLRAGDRVRLWLSAPGCPAVVIVGDLTVQQVRDTARAFGTSDGAQTVVAAVSPEGAQQVIAALAVDGGTIRAGELSGHDRPSASNSAPDVDLSGCRRPATR